MTAMPFSFPIFKAFTTTGTLGPLAGGLLHTFEAGTSTPLAVYQDDALTTPHTNPVVLDSNGQTTIYLGPNAYKMRLEDSTGAIQPGWPIDNIEDALGNAKDYTDTLRSDLAASSGSSLVGFIQSGTGAVARTVQDKGRDSVSVLDFGAVGNGVADDTAAFNAAKIAFPNGTIYVPNGIYRVNIDLSTEMIRMVGEGRRTTILKPAIDAPVISIGNMAGSYQGISLENLELEGVAGFASPGILFKNTPNINDYHKLERLHIRNFTNGIEILGRTIWSTMRDVEIASCSENGLYGHGANVLLNQLLVEHCTFEYTQKSGFKLEGQNPGITSTLKFLHCNFENCGLDASATDTAGCYVSNVHEVEFDNCYFESNSQTSTDNKGSGIRISGTYGIGVNIHGCLSWSTQNAIYNDASFTNGTYEGNRLAGTIHDVYVATTHIESMISLGSNVYGSKAAKLNFVKDGNGGLNHVSSFAPLCLTHSSSSSSATSAYNRGLINFTNSSPITVSNFTDGMPGQILILFNNGLNIVTLQHANTNGIYCPGGANYAMSAGKSATLVNDGTRGWVVTCTT